MHEQNQKARRYSLKEAFAIGTAAVALLGPSLYATLQPNEKSRQKAAIEMLELYGEAAMAGGMYAAGKKVNIVMRERRGEEGFEPNSPRRSWAELPPERPSSDNQPLRSWAED